MKVQNGTTRHFWQFVIRLRKGFLFAALVMYLLLLQVPAVSAVELPQTNLRLLDNADVLTNEEETTLRGKLDRVSEEYNFDFVIVTMQNIENWAIEEFAGEYFDQNGFGRGDGKLGCTLVFVVDSGEHGEWYVSAPDGTSADAVNLYCIDFLADHTDFQDDLRGGKYYEAFDEYIDFVTDCVHEAQTSAPYSETHRIGETSVQTSTQTTDAAKDETETKKESSSFNRNLLLIAAAVLGVAGIALILYGVLKNRAAYKLR